MDGPFLGGLRLSAGREQEALGKNAGDVRGSIPPAMPDLPRFRAMATCRAGHAETCMLALIQTIVLALDIYWWIIIGAAIFSWLYAFNVVNPRNEFVGMIGHMLFKMTDPALRPIRRYLPDLGGIDISPIILLLLIFFIRQFLLTTVAPAIL
jgi:YggT family protein